MTTSQNGRNLIESFEQLRLIAYRDNGGVLTIGFGHTKGVCQGDVITTAQADQYLGQDLADAEFEVNGLGLELNQNMFDVLVSLVFNCGLQRLKDDYPKLLQSIATNPYNFCVIVPLWLTTAIHDRMGNELTGLKRRRLKESNLYQK